MELRHKWACLDCDSTHSSKEKAENCCYIDYWPDDTIFRCSLCAAEYDTVDAARDCCDHSGKVYLCPECDEVHNTEWEAVICCPRDYDKQWQLRCDPKLLEAIGQKRLFD